MRQFYQYFKGFYKFLVFDILGIFEFKIKYIDFMSELEKSRNFIPFQNPQQKRMDYGNEKKHEDDGQRKDALCFRLGKTD